MKKIGIVTFYYAHNYGAVLQAYALKTYLQELGNEVYMFPHLNNSISRMYPKNLKPIIPKKEIFMPLRWKDIFNELKKVKYSKTEWSIRYKKFNDFIEENLLDNNCTNKIYKDDFDIIYFGSDQIWEKNIVGNDLTYFGRIDTVAIKIGYAGSCFSNKSIFTKEMVEELKKFEMLSAREQEIAEKVSELTDKEVITVCDPVFLLDANEYIRSIPQLQKEDSYILFYFVAEDKKLSEMCDYIRNNLHKKVIEIHYFKYKKTNSDYRIEDGPIEFINLIKNADEVYTNSFHGTAFSIIFHKQFYVISNNMRLLNVLNIFNLNDRVIENIKDVDVKKINYEIVDVIKKEYVNISKRYIEESLKKVEM